MADVKSVIGKIMGGGIHNPGSRIVGDHGSHDKMDYNTFYSVVSRSKIQIPTANITVKKIKGRNFAVGTYTANGKTYKAYKVLASDFKK
jgi:hypothetical protein